MLREVLGQRGTRGNVAVDVNRNEFEQALLAKRPLFRPLTSIATRASKDLPTTSPTFARHNDLGWLVF